MGFLKKLPPVHHCLPPIPTMDNVFGPGSIWECDKCKQVWEYKLFPGLRFPQWVEM